MTVNCVNIANIYLLVRINETRELFPSVNRVLSILQTTSATSAGVERVNCKGRVRKGLVQFRLPAMHRSALSAAITQLIYK